MARADTLAVAPSGQHTDDSCGQSRSRGFATSVAHAPVETCFGRVAVTHVQGSPKGGGALGLLRVLNTRLALVPPRTGEAIVDKRLAASLRCYEQQSGLLGIAFQLVGRRLR